MWLKVVWFKWVWLKQDRATRLIIVKVQITEYIINHNKYDYYN